MIISLPYCLNFELVRGGLLTGWLCQSAAEWTTINWLSFSDQRLSGGRLNQIHNKTRQDNSL